MTTQMLISLRFALPLLGSSKILSVMGFLYKLSDYFDLVTVIKQDEISTSIKTCNDLYSGMTS